MVGSNIINFSFHMKKVLFLLIAIVPFLILSSCGEKGMTPKNENITGPLGQYFKVVNRSYQAANGTLFIEFQRIEDGLPDPWTEEAGKTVGWNDGEIEPSFSVEFYDKTGNIVSKAKTLDLSNDLFNDNKEELQKIVDLSKGESCSVSFELQNESAIQFVVSSSFEYHPKPVIAQLSPEQEAEIKAMVDRYEKMAIEIITEQKENEVLKLSLYTSSQELANTIHEKIDNSTSIYAEHFNDIETKLVYSATFGPQENSLDFIENKEENEATADSSNADWASVIDEYESIVDKYIEVFKKAQDGDLSAITESASYLEKANELSEKLSKLNDNDITTDQIEKITEIASKLATSMAGN